MGILSMALALAGTATGAAAAGWDCTRTRICLGEIGSPACVDLPPGAGGPVRLALIGGGGTSTAADVTQPLALDRRRDGGLDLSYPNSSDGPRAVMFLDPARGRAIAVQLAGLEVEMTELSCKEAG